MSVSTSEGQPPLLPRPYAAALTAEGAPSELAGAFLLTAAEHTGQDRVLAGAEFLRAHGAPTPHAVWRPLLPLRLTDDAQRAVGLRSDGECGTVHFVDICVAIGAPPWDTDWLEPWPQTAFEALVWGVDLAELLTDEELTIERHGARGEAVVLSQEGTALATVRVATAQTWGTPGFTARCDLSSGNIAVRDTFAPGSVCQWDGVALEHRSAAGRPAGPGQMRPAASGAGGAPARELVRWLALDSADEPLPSGADLRTQQDDALRIVREVDRWMTWREAA